MSNQRIVGVALLVIGIVLIIVGINSSNSISDQVSDAFTGRFTQNTMLFIVGGIAVSIIGLLMTLNRVFRTGSRS